MNQVRWSEAKEAFHRAYELPPPQQQQFLATLDTNLRRDVESLLRHDPKDFLEKSATQYAVELLRHEPVPERLGPYRIVKQLGHGGMATVYLAERADGQFEKRVAIKILHGSVTEDDQRNRFRQERQLLANLDHPNIVRVIDGNVTPDGRPYLVEDYVEGTPITAYAESRKLSEPQRVQLFLQVVRAIHYAHGLGIVHRDLKPDNILVSAEGVVKLIDFGIAGIATDSQQTGGALRYWTPGYASPEQVKGEPTGTASDVYSLGTVLYELLSGKRYSVQAAGFPEIHRPLRGLLRSCLASDPRKRPDVAGLRAALRAAAQPSGWRIGVGVAALAVLAFAAIAFRREPPRSSPAQLQSVPIAAEESFEYEPVLSPDGKDVVYVWNEGYSSRGLNLYRKPVAGGAPEQLTSAHARDAFPQYSPDGKQILFSRSRRQSVEIVRLDLATRRENVIHRMESALEGAQRGVRWAVWMADGKHIALVRHVDPSGPYAVFLARADGAILRQLTFPSSRIGGDRHAAASPDGKFLAFVRFTTGSTSEIHLLPLDGGEPRQITRHATFHNGIAWSPDSRHIYFGARIRSALWSIYRIGVDPDGVVERLPGIEGSSSWPSVAGFAGRIRLVYHRDEETVNVRSWAQPYAAGEYRVLCPSTLFDGGVSASPAGQQVAFSSTRGGLAQIWACDSSTGKAVLASGPNDPHADSPRWSPDGARIAYTVTENDSTDIAIADRSTGAVNRVRLDGSKEGRPSWSHDGRFLFFRSDRGGASRIWRVTATGDVSTMTAVTGSGAYEAIESPDGKWLYYAKDRAHLGLFRVPTGGGNEQLAAKGVREGWWEIARDGVYWIRQHKGSFLVERLRWGASLPEPVTVLPEGGGVWSGFSVSRDGRTLYWSQSTRRSIDVMLLDGLESH